METVPAVVIAAVVAVVIAAAAAAADDPEVVVGFRISNDIWLGALEVIRDVFTDMTEVHLEQTIEDRDLSLLTGIMP